MTFQDTKEIYDRLRNILTGQESVKLYLEFLKRNNHADLLVLKTTKVNQIPFSFRAD
jgi:26S proteasome regulatory subunit N2